MRLTMLQSKKVLVPSDFRVSEAEMGGTVHFARKLSLLATEYFWKGLMEHLLIGSLVLYMPSAIPYCVFLQPTGKHQNDL